MAKKRKALGKGLSALIPEEIEVEDSNSIENIDVDLITPNPNQPRKMFDKEKLNELSESIKQHGLIQPIIVRKEENLYRIIAGERRWRACKIAGLTEIPSIIRDIENRNASEIALIENIQREDLNPIDEAQAYEYIMNRYDATQEELSKIVGKSRVYVTNIMRLLKLDDYVKDKIKSNEITSGHGRALLSVNKENQIKLTDKIIAENLSVRDIEKLVRENKSTEKIKKVKVEKDKYIAYVEELLTAKFSTKVNINKKKNKGKIEIEYKGNNDLNRILELLKVIDN